MKVFNTALLLLMFASLSFSQNASTYFPTNPGYKWYYKNTPLDSLNNPQTSLATYQVDSFSTVTTFQGLQASKVVSKSGLTGIAQNSPYTDTNYYNFQTTNGWYYLNVLSLIGNIPLFDSVAFVNFLRSFEAWYNTYRFAQTVNTNYTIFTKDTTISIDTLTLPLRISTTGRRLNDATISTVNGTYLAKKFLMTFQISYGLLPPILYIPIVTRPDTVYIAQDVWVVKETMPSTNVDLTSIGIAVAFSIPGSMKELTQGPTGIVNQTSAIAIDFQLNQNYPNPFNPSTNINYSIPTTQYTMLKVYDALGNEVETLVNERQTPGSYSVKFDGGKLSSGIYFYELKTENFSETKKMLFVK